MNRRMGKKKLARLILAALMTTGGFWGSSAEAAATEYDWNGSSVVDPIVDSGGFYRLNPASGYNTLNLLSPGNTTKFVEGGWCNDATALTGYTINVKSGIWDGVYGALADGSSSGLVSGNTVTVSGTVNKVVVGGASKGSGNVENNIVNIKGGVVGRNVPGGAEIRGGYIEGGSGNATGNKVNIESGGGTATVYGAYTDSTGNVEKNAVTIGGGTRLDGSVMGGRSNSGNATGNTVTISGGTVGSDTSSMHYGGYSNSGDAEGNAFNVEGGIVNGNIYGAQGVNVTNNTVNISGGIINGIIYPAMAMGGTASGNVINILKVFNTTSGVFLDGEDGGGYTSTLNVAAKGVTVNGMFTPFQQMNFFLPTDMTKDDVMLNVSGDATVTKAKVGVMAQGKLENLTKDNKVTLLSAETLTGGDTITQAATSEIVVPTGLTTSDKYEFKVANEGNTIVATITKDDSGSGGGGDDPTPSPSPDDPTNDIKKSPVEVRAATVTMLNAGADMLASQGFAQAANAVAIEAAEQAKTGAAEGTNGAVGAPAVRSFTPFAAFGGSSLRAESGSHVDTKGFGINVGFAKEFSNSQGKLLFGPVVEYGGGKYDSYNNDVHGDGNSHYWGFGLMARQTNHDGFYYEGSVRFGRVTSDYSADLPTGVHASYDSASNYWAAHLGVGKVFATGKQDTVDAYLKYFYSHQGGDDTDITLSANGGTNTQRANFDSVNSNRIRIGARYTHKVNEMNSFYGGLAYQYEFGGEARAHYNGTATPSPSVKGSSGMLELGWQVKPGGPVTIDLGVTGWAGKQKGGSVQLGATWTF